MTKHSEMISGNTERDRHIKGFLCAKYGYLNDLVGKTQVFLSEAIYLRAYGEREGMPWA